MKNTIISLLFVSFFINSFGQISYGGEPHGWDSKVVLPYEIFTLPEFDLEAMQAEDEINDRLKTVPYRFGKNIAVDIDIYENGIWTELENGDGIWRLALKSKSAVSLNFVFDAYYVPAGGRLFVYTEDKSQLLGSFTNENASKNKSLGVGLVFSEKAIIEYHEPAEVRGEGYLHINNVTHGYRDILVDVENEAKGAFGNSGACNINVNCPEGLPFDFQKRSVALIVVGNSGICSGALVNNVQQDGTPFFLTANHCLPTNSDNTQNWVFYFNHETPGCIGNDGPTNQSIAGGTVLSRNAESDFALLELNEPPPPSFQVCYSGWDATDSEGSVSSAFGIHHPQGDIKKVCIEEDAPFHTILNFENTPTSVWYVNEWEAGVTQPGSSGSPIFNQNGLLIGQLAGGSAACIGEENNGGFDYYGRFGVSYSNGATPSTAIRYWLDPSVSGTLIVPNSCNSNLPDLNASLGSLTGIPEISCDLSPFTPSINVVNLGVENIEVIELEITLNGNSNLIQWEGNLAPAEDTFLALGSFVPSNGTNNFSVKIITVNGQEDLDELGNMTNRAFTALSQALEISVNIVLDNFPNETTWSITNDLDEVIATGGTYTEDDNPVSETQCLTNGCYDFIIFDSANDGICCGYGKGSYSVEDEFGNVLATGGEFDSSDTTEICVVLDLQDLNASLGNITGIPVASCGPASFSPSVEVLNLGTDTIEDIALELSFNGSQEIILWSGITLPQESTVVPLGNFTPSVGVNNFDIEILSLNGQADTDASGNEAGRSFEIIDQALAYININLDNRPNETTWRIANEFEEVLFRGGPYSENDGSVNDTLCLIDGCYTFTILDSSGDGICCENGQGSYSLSDRSGKIWAEGSDFNFQEMTEFCLNLDTSGTSSSELNLFPNPATNILKIDAGNIDIDQVSLYNVNGQLIAEKKKIESPRTFFNTDALPSGLYIVEVARIDGIRIRDKAIVTREK